MTSDPVSRRVLAALDAAVERLEAVERSRTEPIAVIGIGCRFPGGADGPDAFWELLRDGVDAIADVPGDRWSADALYDADPAVHGKTYVRGGGFLDGVDRFDASFFDISPREAISLDPQQRLLLEVSWEALEHAGANPRGLGGSASGVFVGVTTSDYARLLTSRSGLAGIDTYFGTGNTLNSTAGRLSYVLGLEGPSLAVDTACSSSLVSVHLACHSLRSGECDLALAAGVNLILTPEATIALSRARMLSADGRCKTFDESADGYGRGEGCGVVVLKRLSDAEAAGDNVLALIRGSAVNQDGASGGFTVPSGLAQQRLIRLALSNAGVEPGDVDYVEAHGTGTPLGDPIEIRALVAALGQARSPERPLIVGSVKTNLGHLESAAGIAGLIKTILALRHREIPPHLHLKHPSAKIPWRDIPVVVPTGPTAWVANGKARVAGVSSFGASGTNAHVVVQEAPIPEARAAAPAAAACLLTLSARTEPALEELAVRYERYLAANGDLDVANVCFTASTGRAEFDHRLCLVARSIEEACEKLRSRRWFQGKAQARSPEIPAGAPAERIAELWVQGAVVDWGTLPRESRPHRVPLPTYPWQRERYWPEGPSASNEDWLYAVEWVPQPRPAKTPDEVVRGLKLRVVDAYWNCIPALERAAAGYARAAVGAVGVVAAGQERLWERVREMAGEAEGEATEAERRGEAEGRGGLAAGEWALLERCGGQLREVLEGKVEGLKLLFPETGMTAEALYAESAGARAMNALVGQAVGAIVGGRGAEPWRVLEIGAGTGGTTAAILPELAGGRAEYVYTDVSGWFVGRGREKFGGHGWVRYAVLDIEEEPGAEHRGRYDVIVAANVLHATRDVGQSVRHVRRMLRPGGLVVVLEGTKRLRCMDVIFGVTAGWWRYADAERGRGRHPLLGVEAWERVLKGNGFEAVAATAGDGILSTQAVLVGQADRRGVERKRWWVVGDAQGVGGRVRRALGAGGEGEEGEPEGIVYVGNLEGTGGQGVGAAGQERCVRTLEFVQGVLGRQWRRTPKLWVVTRGAQERVVDVAGSGVWGLGRTLALEHPELGVVRVDLDGEAGEEGQAAQLVEELGREDGEGEVVYRGGTRHVGRLRRWAGAGGARRGVVLDGGKTYVVTGGTRGLGLEAARWLVRKGAKRLVLVNRSGEGNAATAALERAGVEVRVRKVDMGDEGQVDGLMGEIEREMGAVGGIIHSAGELADGVVQQQTRGRYERVLGAKVRGAWRLHEWTAGKGLEFFVLFSTAAAVLGSAGQSNHAAANAFMDGLAAYRRGRGEAGLSINWGAWAEVGAAAGAAVQARVAGKGLGRIGPGEGIRVLEQLMGAEVGAQVAVVPIDWPRFLAQFPATPFYSEFSAAGASHATEPAGPDVLQQLDAAPANKRLALMMSHVRSHVAEVLCLPAAGQIDPQRGFFELGMDSLTSVELRTRLQRALRCAVPATLAFDYPTIEALSRHLLETVFPPAAEPPDETPAQKTDLDDVPDQELARRLGAQLALVRKQRA